MPRSLSDLALPLADIESEGSRRNYLIRAFGGAQPALVDGWLDGEKRRFHFWKGTECGDVALYQTSDGPQLRPMRDLRAVGPGCFTLAPAPEKPRAALDFADYVLPPHAVTPISRRKIVKVIDQQAEAIDLYARDHDMSRFPPGQRHDLIAQISQVLA
jgi:hypothetical protein